MRVSRIKYFELDRELLLDSSSTNCRKYLIAESKQRLEARSDASTFMKLCSEN